MRHSDRFFSRVWRFNAFAIASATVLFVLMVLFLAGSILYDQARPRQVTNVVNVSDQDAGSNEFSLGTPGVIAGTPYVQVSLSRGSYAGPGSLYPKRSDRNVVNYLFVNISTNESRWLFQGAGQIIVDSYVMFNRLKTASDDARMTVGSFHVVVDRDTNGDQRLSEQDAVSLAASAADGTNYRKLIEGIEQVYSVQQVAADKALVLYLKDKQTMSALFGLPSMVPLMQSSISKLGPN